MEYTKGKWKIDAVGNEGKYCIHTGDISLPFAHTFSNRYRNPQVSSEEAEANAQLISSAPEMYEALKAIMACQTDASTYEMVERYRYVLAKAEGKG